MYLIKKNLGLLFPRQLQKHAFSVRFPCTSASDLFMSTTAKLYFECTYTRLEMGPLKGLWCIVQIFLLVAHIYGVVQVLPECPDTPTGQAYIKVVSDSAVTNPFAECAGREQYSLQDSIDGMYEIYADFTGPHDTSCVFTKQDDVDVYSVLIYVPSFGNVLTVDDQPIEVTCTYDAVGSQDTINSTITDGIQAVEEIIQHQAEVSRSSIDMCVADILRRCITSSIRLGKVIMITAKLIGDYPDEQSFTALSCKAVSGTMKYNFLISGCGDGQVIPRDKGFITKGKTIESPYFRAFKLPGSDPVSFDCTFVVCTSNCDGSSCSAKRRRKREISLKDEGMHENYGKQLINVKFTSKDLMEEKIPKISPETDSNSRPMPALKDDKKPMTGQILEIEVPIKTIERLQGKRRGKTPNMTPAKTDKSYRVEGVSHIKFPIGTIELIPLKIREKIQTMAASNKCDAKGKNSKTQLKSDGFVFLTNDFLRAQWPYIIVCCCVVGIPVFLLVCWLSMREKSARKHQQEGEKNQNIEDLLDKDIREKDQNNNCSFINNNDSTIAGSQNVVETISGKIVDHPPPYESVEAIL